MNSVLVIDEVQAYDPNAAAIVTHLIQQVNSMGGKTLLMTATLPPFILREIVRRMGLEQRHVIRLIDEQNFEQIASASRHRMRFLVHGGDYASVTEEIIDAAVCQNQKVLVVMNTVSAACTIFERVRDGLHDRKQDINTLLLHSRFTQFQRKELEQLAVDKYLPNETDRDNTPCIVIATQIVEASLDIDADIIFTEPAPADSLVQRMGRVFRRYARSTSDNSPQMPMLCLLLIVVKIKEMICS
jgi:CRISPR-associated endonuclease/helicase Cas3